MLLTDEMTQQREIAVTNQAVNVHACRQLGLASTYLDSVRIWILFSCVGVCLSGIQHKYAGVMSRSRMEY